MKKLFLLFICLVFVHTSRAQYFVTGQDPASLKWRQINTENFQIIFPDYYENQAQKLAAEMEKVYLYGGKTLNHKPKKISIILHTQTVKSNGLVAWAPKRAEFYTIPHQGIYAQDWIQQLAVHEFRHVVQIDKINSELPKIIKIILGQQGTALAFGAYFPWWFIEGDAVVAETAFSNSGRGRFPSFLMEHKALAVENGNYKYDKAYNGSYKNYVPNHYQLGYYLVGKTREKYGPELWNSVVDRVGKKPFSLNPFNKALKNQTGLNKVKLYDSVFEDLKNEWIEEDNNFKSQNFEVVSPDKKTYTNYRYNHWLNDSTILSYRTSLNRVPSFVKINSEGVEKRIYIPGTIFNESVNFRDEWLVWSEQIPDPRWQHSGKSFIRLMDVENNRKLTIYSEFTAFAPSISPQKDKIAVIETNFSSDYFLSIYRIGDGQLLNRFQTKKNNYFFSPEWLNENEIITVVLFPEGKRLAKYNIENNQFEIILNQDLGEIKNLKVSENSIYFVGTHSGKNSLYKYDLSNQSVSQIYETRFGLESPAFSPDGNKLLMSDYTADGFRLITTSLKNTVETNIESTFPKRYKLADNLAKQETGVIDFSQAETGRYESEKYSKLRHLFNFHSWAPAAVDASTYDIKPGVSLMSQNKLGTSFLNLGYEWSTSEKTGSFYGKYSYQGFYPILDFEIKSGNSAYEYLEITKTLNTVGEVIRQDSVSKRFTWLETNFSLDANIPFNLSRGRFYRLLQPEIKYTFTNYNHNSSTHPDTFEGNFQDFIYRLYYQQVFRKSNQDVYPNFGFILDGLYRHSPTGKIDFGSLSLAQSYLFLPGLWLNHGIRLFGAVQDKSYSGSSFPDMIRYPRGWGKTNSNQMLSFASDYKFPVFYPEWSLGGLIYLQRVNASLFADFAKITRNQYENGEFTGTYHTDISSFGIELTGNANFLRFYAPVEIGVRASYLPQKEKVYFDFLLSIDFNSL